MNCLRHELSLRHIDCNSIHGGGVPIEKLDDCRFMMRQYSFFITHIHSSLRISILITRRSRKCGSALRFLRLRLDGRRVAQRRKTKNNRRQRKATRAVARGRDRRTGKRSKNKKTAVRRGEMLNSCCAGAGFMLK